MRLKTDTTCSSASPVTTPPKVTLLENVNFGLKCFKISLYLSAGFSWIVDRQQSYQGTHWITFRFSRPVDMPPLTLTFPHPFTMEEESVRVEWTLRAIPVVLKKNTRNPWPGDMVNCSRWKPAELAKWQSNPQNRKRKADDSKLLFDHLHLQFPGSVDDAEQQDPISGVRFIVAAIFELIVRHQCQVITIIHQDDPKRMPVWWLRAHLPICSSPQGAPIVILSAYDQLVASKMLAKQKITNEQDIADLQSIFIDHIASGEKNANLVVSSDSELQLLRQILRHNAATIAPNKWQVLPK